MKTMVGALAMGGLMFAAGAARAEADNGDGLPQWLPTGRALLECGRAFEAGATASRCLKYRFDETVMEYAAQLVDDRGKAVFGENFSFTHRLSWSPFSAAVTRNLDIVIPLHPGDAAPELGNSALFLQQGITRWHDNAGFIRNDIRHGLAYRFALSDEREDVLGVSALYQENIERRHKRLAMTLDYAGRYGTGRLRHFVPASGWRPGRPGYEERAVGGTEIGASVGLTSTLFLDAALASWDEESEHARDISGRIGLGLRPHPWLSLQGGYETGFAGEAVHLRVQLTVPLGGAPKPVPRWEGLGVLGSAGTLPDIWRPLKNVERLQTVERIVSRAAEAPAADIAVKFLQDKATTGSRIGVRVSTTEPVPAN